MLSPSQFPEPGLYLIFPNGDQIDLTRRKIEQVTDSYLADARLIPPSVKAAADYALCSLCPEHGRAHICHAIMPVLPFVQRFESYMSFDTVTAVYRENEQPMLAVAEIPMQQALQFITILSLTQYCETGRSYARYFQGVNPLMPSERIAEEVFNNMYVQHRGDLTAVRTEVAHMQEEIRHTSACQIRRLKLITRSDALTNAFVSAHVISLFIFLTIEDRIKAFTQPTGQADRP